MPIVAAGASILQSNRYSQPWAGPRQTSAARIGQNGEFNRRMRSDHWTTGANRGRRPPGRSPRAERSPADAPAPPRRARNSRRRPLRSHEKAVVLSIRPIALRQSPVAAPKRGRKGRNQRTSPAARKPLGPPNAGVSSRSEPPGCKPVRAPRGLRFSARNGLPCRAPVCSHNGKR